MDFLDHIYFDNTVRNYCIVTGSILFMLILKRFFSRYIASLLFRLFHYTWKGIDKKTFVDLVLEPMEWFLLLLISVFALDKLNFPADLQYRIYGHSTQDITDKLGKAILIISFTWLLMRMIDFIAIVVKQKAAHVETRGNYQLIVFFRDFLKVLVLIIGLLLLIKVCLSQPIGNILTSLSIVGAVLALAAKESLENLIASFIIFFDKPFSTGDTLKVNAVTGTVEKIGLRSTRIRTVDKTLVTVPNKQMVDSVVDNWSMRTYRRAELKIELAGKTSAQEAEAFLGSIKRMLAGKMNMFTSSSVYITELNKNGIQVTLEYFTQPININLFNQLKEDINMALKRILEDHHIELAAPGNTVTIINAPGEDAE